MHNAKFDLLATENCLNQKVAESILIHDTSIQSHLLQNNHPNHALKQLAWELAGYPRDDEQAVKDVVKDGGDYSHVPEFLMNAYQKGDAERTMLLHLFFYPKILANSRWLEIYEMEMELIKVTLRMEQRGVMINTKRTIQLITRLEQQANQTLDRIEVFAGERINPNSPNQVKWLLYKKAKLPILKLTKKAKDPSTDKETLALLRERHPHEILNLIQQFRSWDKGATTLQKYLTLMDSDCIIHPTIKTCGTDEENSKAPATGRESCKNPNLQNVSKKAALLNPYPIPARECFRPRPGFVNFHIDYSGIELRLAVHYCQEPELVEAINKNMDVHYMAAETFYGGKPTKIMRDGAKNQNFAIIYGASADTVARGLGLSKEKGGQAYARYRKRWPKLVSLNYKIGHAIKRDGYIDTAFGRRLHLPRDKGYMGTNYLIQGTAAGIIKRAQNRVHNYCTKNWSSTLGILLPIHDELIIEYPRDLLQDVPEILGKVRELMIDFPQFSVPLEVDIEVATSSWAETKPFSI
jgi:DNA polymerase-1